MTTPTDNAKEVDRYECIIARPTKNGGKLYATMQHSDAGEYVLASDYEREHARAEHATARWCEWQACAEAKEVGLQHAEQAIIDANTRATATESALATAVREREELRATVEFGHRNLAHQNEVAGELRRERDQLQASLDRLHKEALSRDDDGFGGNPRAYNGPRTGA